MPLVHVEMFPGRTDVQKSFLARRIIDAVAEIAGTTREGVHVIFEEVARGAWAIGPRLSSSLGAPPRRADPAFVVVSSIRCKPGRAEEYFAWRRDTLYPVMSGCEGFLGSTVVAVGDGEADYSVIDKWADRDAWERYQEQEPPGEAQALMEETAKTFEGPVVDVINGDWHSK